MLPSRAGGPSNNQTELLGTPGGQDWRLARRHWIQGGPVQLDRPRQAGGRHSGGSARNHHPEYEDSPEGDSHLHEESGSESLAWRGDLELGLYRKSNEM